MIGTTIYHFRILEKIGGGGMGTVYKAEDLQLQRTVALKFLSPQWSASEEARERFLREAKAASVLDHANTCTIHQIGTTPDGQIFIVMALYGGETLQARLARGPLPAAGAVAIALGACHGLAKAHRHGIIHRDIKPSNLMITEDEVVKVLDFGIAKLAGAAGFTQEGRIVGSVDYMSPEQVCDEEVDHRSDIWSLGVVLYEMLSGQNPFRSRSTQAAFYAVLNKVPRPLGEVVPGLPPHLEEVVTCALAKAPGHRFRSMEEMAEALSGEQPTGTATVSFAASPSTPGLPRRPRSIAVLPFVDTSPYRDGSHAYLGLGLADTVIAELSQVKSLLVRPTSAILRYQDRTGDPLEAARELRVDTFVDGTFQRLGDRLRVTVQLIDAADLRTLWATKLDRTVDELFQVQDEISRSIAKTLVHELTPEDQRRLAFWEAARPPDAAVYDLYLQGRMNLYRATRSSFVTAADLFGKALAEDGSFALAWVGKGECYARIAYLFDPEGDWYDRATEACAKALALSPGLPEACALQARLAWMPHAGFAHKSALRGLVPAIRARPNLEEAHMLLGVVLQHIGLLDAAMQELDQALAISPDDLLVWEQRVLCLYQQGRFEEALTTGEAVSQREPAIGLLWEMALAQVQLGRLSDAERTARLMLEQWPEEFMTYSAAGLVAARQGRTEEALRQIELTVQHKKAYGHYHHGQYDVGCILALLGQKDEAVVWLREAARNGFPCYPVFCRDPLLDPLRDHEPFVRFLTEMRKEHEDYAACYAGLLLPGTRPNIEETRL
jgi:serine/threonine protein kinase/Flp pilus assembly protein TadD